MKRKDWTVKILKRFKEPLERRFNPNNAKREFDRSFIRVECELCKHYKTPKTYQCSKRCPFSKFQPKISRLAGCGVWIVHVLGNDADLFTLTVPAVWWDPKDNKICKFALIRLKRAADKLIEWI